MKAPMPTRAHLAVAVALAFTLGSVAGLSWAFSEQLTLSDQLREEEARLQLAIEREMARYDELVERLEFVQSDTYVDQWAREQMHMRKADERLMLPPRQAGPEVSPDALAPARPVEVRQRTFLQELWEMLVGPQAGP